MKTLIKQIAIAVVIASLGAVSAFAKTKKESITLSSNTNINGTVVKKGTYQLTFDDEKGELSILKGDKVVAQASTTTEKRDVKARHFELRLSGSGDQQQLTGIAFAGADRNILLSGTSASR